MSRAAVIRFDAGALIGGGHAMRCLALAEALSAEGWSCTLVLLRETLASLPVLEACGHAILTVESDTERESLASLPATDLVVIDHYRRDAAYEQWCRDHLHARILAIDDFFDRPHACDILVNPTPTPVDLPNCPPGALGLSGGAYAPLRSEFRCNRLAALRQRRALERPQRLVIAFGLSDPANATSLALRAIARLRGVSMSVDVIIGSAAPHLEEVLALCADLSFARLHCDSPNSAELLSNADLAVGAAGVGALERCCLGLPSLILIIADNQREGARQLAQAGAALILGEANGFDPAQLAAAIEGLWRNPARLRALSLAAASLCDGRGALRLAQAAWPEGASDGSAVILRPASLSDGEIMLEWQRDPEIRKFSRNPRVPEEAEHWAWLNAKMADPACIFSIIEADLVPVGVLRLDWRDDRTSPGYEVSILVAPGRHGRGLGLAALHLARRLVPEARLLATILPGNFGSAKLFAKAGYRQEADCWVHVPLFDVRR